MWMSIQKPNISTSKFHLLYPLIINQPSQAKIIPDFELADTLQV